jgi:hypothetical protein
MQVQTSEQSSVENRGRIYRAGSKVKIESKQELNNAANEKAFY